MGGRQFRSDGLFLLIRFFSEPYGRELFFFDSRYTTHWSAGERETSGFHGSMALLRTGLALYVVAVAVAVVVVVV